MNSKYILGFDIGGTKCSVTAAHIENGICLDASKTIPTNAKDGFEQTWSRIVAAARDLLAEQAIANKSIKGIGVSCGGPLDAGTGIIHSPPHLPGWDDIPLAKMLEDEFCAPAFICNDANACALVEWKIGAGKGCSDMIFLTMGTGFGAGIVSAGKLIEGAVGMAGEIGHVRLEADGPCVYGKCGSVEGFCSGDGIAKLALELCEKRQEQGNRPQWGNPLSEITAKKIGDYAIEGDADALALLETVGAKLGKSISILADILNPQVVVIGSVFVRLEQFIRPAMQAAIDKECLPVVSQALKVLPAQTGNRLGDYAAVMVACHSLKLDIEQEHSISAGALAVFEDLLERYPKLSDIRTEILLAFNTMRRTYERGGKMMICGNGGSAADAEHIVGELMKGFLKLRPLDDAMLQKMELAGIAPQIARQLQCGLPAIALSSHPALSTAFSNDVNAELAFAQPLQVLAGKDDMLLAISTSGNSGNVLLAAQVAAAKGLPVVALTGGSGGKLKDMADVAIVAPGDNTPQIQEMHLPVYHALCAMLEEHFFGKNK